MPSGVQKFVSDVGFSFASLSISSLCHFILRVFLGRYLGTEDLGLYTLSFTVYSVGMLFSGFGLGSALNKHVAEFKEDIPKINSFVSAGSILSFAIGSVMGIILFSTSTLIATRFFNMPELAGLLRIVSLVFPFIGLEKAVLGFLTGLRRMRLFTLINIAQSILTIILTVVLVLAGAGLSGAVFSLILPVVLLGLFSLFTIRKSLIWPKSLQPTPAMKMLLGFGGYVILASSIDVIQQNIGSIMIGHFMNATEVGYYSVAIILSGIMLLIPGAVQTITTPVMSTYYGRGEIQKIEELINRTMRYTANLLIPAAFLLAFLGKEIVVLIFGEAFVPASFPLQILLIGSLCAGIPISISTALSSTAYVNMLFKLSCAGLLANIALNWLLIPRLGITGAAIATSITMIINAALCLYFIQRLIGIKVQFKWFIKIFIVVGLLAVATYALSLIFNLYIVVSIATIALVFALLIFFNSREDLKLIKIILRKG